MTRSKGYSFTAEIKAIQERTEKFKVEFDKFCNDILAEVDRVRWSLDPEYREQLLNGRR